MPNLNPAFWSLAPADLLASLESRDNGLTDEEAASRLARYGPNQLRRVKRAGSFRLLAGQFKSPISLILLFAAGLSAVLDDATDAIIILAIVLASGLLGFWQERGAHRALEALLALVTATTRVLRGGSETTIPAAEVVPGDVVMLSAGAVVPADGRLLDGRDLHVNEAALTGESFPVEKTTATLAEDTPLGRRTNCVFTGTHVVSGTARILVAATGPATEFGRVSERLAQRPAETEFEHGVRRFGYLLMEVTSILVLAIFAFNVALDRPVLDSLLFSLALAVGLTPQLLPAVITVNLAHGARRMADRRVIVRRLTSIENFGSMTLLCTDKTGTLTEGTVRVRGAVDAAGRTSEKVQRLAYINASYETGFPNPIDDAIRAHRAFDLTGCRKLDEIPYDFVRKRLSVLVSEPEGPLLITKGAVPNVLEACTTVELADGRRVALEEGSAAVRRQFEQASGQGLRTIGVACRRLSLQTAIQRADEAGLTFVGFLMLHDPPKPDIATTLDELHRLGISLKVITGDNGLVAGSVAAQVGLPAAEVLSGPDMRQLSDDALARRVLDTHVFAEIEPNQKERLILALRRAGCVVGYLGDGINDAPALRAADVGISVDSAVDVAKEAADIVLLDRHLGVLLEGVKEGRRTFANTLKYVFMATSANFGNMFSMAAASLLLPFLPLLPKQILLTNLVTDLPEMAIAGDGVDPELVAQPRRWDIRFIRRFMIVFGLLSSVFDFVTFGVLLVVLDASVEQFRTGWFIESVISAALIVLVVRTRRPFVRSRPAAWLAAATALVVALVGVLPLTPVAGALEFERLPIAFVAMLAGIVTVYVLAAELVKRVFYRWSG